jgi:hypothetical protein
MSEASRSSLRFSNLPPTAISSSVATHPQEAGEIKEAVLALRCCPEEIHEVTECLFELDMLAVQLQEVISDLDFSNQQHPLKSQSVCFGIVDGSYVDYKA